MHLTAGKPIPLHCRKRRGGSGDCFLVEFIPNSIGTPRNDPSSLRYAGQASEDSGLVPLTRMTARGILQIFS